MKKIFYRSLFTLILFMTASTQQINAETTEQTIYGIGSVSKVFGAAAIMKLVDRGEVELDTFVTKYLPEFEMADPRYRDITVRMLLNHSSGIMGTTYQNNFLLGDSSADYHSYLLDNLKKQELKADPGEYSVYCNDGFTLAEIIVERVSGMSFAQFIETEFTKPLGMNHTFMPASAKGRKDTAPIYYRNRLLPYENIQSLASGGIYSSAEDLCRLSTLFTENGAGILSEKSVTAMSFPEYQTNQIGVQNGDSNFGYGLGWDSVDAYPFSNYGITALTKGGDTGNYSAGLIVLPEQKLSVSVVTSGGGSEQCQVMANQLIQEILKEESLLDKEKNVMQEIPDTFEKRKLSATKNLPVIPQDLYKYQGTYASGEIFQLKFTSQNTAQITSLENNREMVQEYIYTEEGDFISTAGKYFAFTNLAQTENGISGITAFHFSREVNGKTYMMGTTYILSGGKAQAAITMPFAEKITENKVSDSINLIWNDRNGIRYYNISDAYNSYYYLTKPFIKVEALNRFQGYTGSTDAVKNCRIIDEDNAVSELDLPVMTGRDLRNYHFSREGATEYLELGDDIYMKEDAIPKFPSENINLTLTSGAMWYHIGSENNGREIKIILPEKGAYYVYDKESNCIASSLFQDEKESILLPKDGKILLVGEVNSHFVIME